MKLKIVHITTLFLFLIYSFILFASAKGNDSLNSNLNLSIADTAKVNNLLILSAKNKHSDSKAAMAYAKQAFKIARSLNWKIGMGNALFNVGDIYYMTGEFANALNCFQTAQLIAEKENNKMMLQNVFSGIGLVYLSQSDLPKALDFFLKALRINEEIKNDAGILLNMGNIGVVYVDMKNYSEAIKYYTSVLVMAESSNNVTLKMNQLANLGTVYAEQSTNANSTDTKIELLHKALEYYEKSLVIAKETSNINTEIVILINLAALYSELYEIVEEPKEKIVLKKKAKAYFLIVLEHIEKYENKYYKSIILGNLGNLYRNSGEFKKAEEHLKSALQISKELNALSILKDQEKYIYLLYDTIGNYNKALEHYKNFIAIKDSISNEENTRNNIKLQMQYEFEKKEALSLEENKREIQVLKEKEKRQTIFFYSIIGGFLALVVIAFLIFRNLKYTRQQNKIIQSKNKDILDSITYAKRIQEAILPSENIWNEALPNSFILYLPKDIVAGDFYWLETISVIANEERVKQSVNNEKIASPESLRSQNRNDIILFAACDCTGHGVPGAMVSVVCANALSKATIEEGITEPEKILERTSRIVVEKLNRNNEDVKDGMDISLCTINIKENNIYTLQWAGANNPLLIIRPTTYATEPSAPIIASEERTKQSTATKEEIASLPTVARNEENAVTSSVRPSANVSRSDSNYELIEYKPNKQPIGKMDMPQPFTRHTIELQKGDTIYVFTDGFADQFGGENNKKYMIKKLKIFLLSIAHLPLKEQKEKLAEEFNAWKGSNEQVDDVCVIGVKI